MKRSEINAAIRQMEKLINDVGFYTPPFLSWPPEEWSDKGEEYNEIRDNMLGWDVTDYGLGRFDQVGLTLATLRNGNASLPQYSKNYCEKLVMLRETQVAPMHFHWRKMEDIVNRGGGNALVRLYNAKNDNSLDTEGEVLISTDGRNYLIKAGETVRLRPGESMSMLPGTYHEIRVEKGTGLVLLGEISSCNDDLDDNCFLEKVGRFPEIEEDEPAYKLLCSEYPAAVKQ